MSLRTLAFVGSATAIVAVTLGVAFARPTIAAGPIDASAYRLPPADRAVLDDVVIETSPTWAMSRDAVMGLLPGVYDPTALGAARVDAYLEGVTVLGTLRSPDRIEKRSVWIIRMSGMSQEAPAPPADTGSVEARILHTAYVFIDAETGSFLMTEWVE